MASSQDNSMGALLKETRGYLSDRMEYEEFTDKQLESQEDDKFDDSDSNDDSESEDDSDCCTNNYVIKMKHGDVDADHIVEYNIWQRDWGNKVS